VGTIKLKDLDTLLFTHVSVYEITDQIIKNISFSYYDCKTGKQSYPQESIFGNFDLVMCSNLLFYYQEEQQKAILKKLINALSRNGYFITGEAEKQTVSKITGVTHDPTHVLQYLNKGVEVP
jgi:chemotaxis methyl-accepting protein methylase